MNSIESEVEKSSGAPVVGGSDALMGLGGTFKRSLPDPRLVQRVARCVGLYSLADCQRLGPRRLAPSRSKRTAATTRIGLHRLGADD
jgi:hypothetical protein